MATESSTYWPQSQRAWLYTSAPAGLDKSLKLHNDAAPPPQTNLTKDAILVKVEAMSLNPADYKLAEMGLISRALISPPASPGMDYAGRIASVGSGVVDFRVGQEVFGRVDPTKFGTLAEYVVVKDKEGVVAIPDGFKHGVVEASCVGTVGLTALQSIQPYVAPGKGEKVFINGGSGGTGTFGIQIAKALGCHVTTSCSGANVELCKSLGADEVIDYSKENVSEVLKGKGQVFKLVVDNVGTSPSDLYKAADVYMVAGGNFIQVGGGGSMADIKSTTSRALLPTFLGGGKTNFKLIMTKQSHAGLKQIGQWMKEDKVRAVVDEVFAFEDAPKAYEKLKTGRVKGKIVVKVSK